MIMSLCDVIAVPRVMCEPQQCRMMIVILIVDRALRVQSRGEDIWREWERHPICLGTCTPANSQHVPLDLSCPAPVRLALVTVHIPTASSHSLTSSNVTTTTHALPSPFFPFSCPWCMQELTLEEYETALAEKKAALNKKAEARTIDPSEMAGLKVGGEWG